jgi:hypothetical protein
MIKLACMSAVFHQVTTLQANTDVKESCAMAVILIPVLTPLIVKGPSRFANPPL